MARRPSRAKARIKLPRYMRPRPLADGTDAYFWELPAWARPTKIKDGGKVRIVRAERHGVPCPVESQALGPDLAGAISKANEVNAKLDGWRLGTGAFVPVTGTVGWLLAWYEKHDRFKTAAFKTRRDYKRAFDLLASLPLKSGGAFGERKASEVQGTTADKLYKRLATERGARQARYAMQAACRVWYEAGRNTKDTGIALGPEGIGNPFARMGISTKAKKGNRATSRTEYDIFRAKAREMGLQSMATGAAIMFELVRRATDAFGFEFGGEPAEGAFYWEPYQPGESFAMHQGKTGNDQVIPLRGEPDPDSADPEVREKGPLLYPELEAELARTARGEPDREVDGRPMTSIVISEGVYGTKSQRYTEDQAGRAFRAIRDAGGLPKAMTLTGFRHGGATELGDAGVEDIRPISGHATRSQSDVYNKITEQKARAAGTARRRKVEGGKG